MSDLLFDHPELWTDKDNNTPPAAWDGTKYVFLQGTYVVFNGTTVAGDTISGTGSFVNDPLNLGSILSIQENEGAYDNYANAVYGDASPVAFANTLAAGITQIEIDIFGNSSGYTGNVTIERAGPPPVSSFWTDFVNTIEQ